MVFLTAASYHSFILQAISLPHYSPSRNLYTWVCWCSWVCSKAIFKAFQTSSGLLPDGSFSCRGVPRISNSCFLLCFLQDPSVNKLCCLFSVLNSSYAMALTAKGIWSSSYYWLLAIDLVNATNPGLGLEPVCADWQKTSSHFLLCSCGCSSLSGIESLNLKFRTAGLGHNHSDYSALTSVALILPLHMKLELTALQGSSYFLLLCGSDTRVPTSHLLRCSVPQTPYDAFLSCMCV